MVVRVGVINNFITRGRVTMTDIVRDSGSKVRVEAITQCLGMECGMEDNDLEAAQMPRTRGA
jgi:hypothetical protein